VILYEMLAGAPPFQGRTHGEVLAQHLTKTPPPLPPSAGLEEAVMWLLEKEADRRPRDARLLLNALDSLRVMPDATTLRSEPEKITLRTEEPERVVPEDRTDLMGAEDTVTRPTSNLNDLLEAPTFSAENSDEPRTEITEHRDLDFETPGADTTRAPASPPLEFEDRTTPDAPVPSIVDIVTSEVPEPIVENVDTTIGPPSAKPRRPPIRRRR
jgi:serine/threonine protein kinase